MKGPTARRQRYREIASGECHLYTASWLRRTDWSPSFYRFFFSQASLSLLLFFPFPNKPLAFHSPSSFLSFPAFFPPSFYRSAQAEKQLLLFYLINRAKLEFQSIVVHYQLLWRCRSSGAASRRNACFSIQLKQWARSKESSWKIFSFSTILFHMFQKDWSSSSRR